MNQETFTKDFELVNNWVNSMRPHWKHLKGNVHNDKDFWQQCIHSVRPEVWVAWSNLFHTLEESMPGAFAGHTYIADDTEVIYNRSVASKVMTIPYNKTGYNKPIFRAAMAIKDIMAEITEHPFAVVEKASPQTVVKKAKPTREEMLKQWAIMDHMIQDLFE